MTDATDIEVHVERDGETLRVGTLHRHAARRGETVTFEYAGDWLAHPERFAIDPSAPLGGGTFAPRAGRALLGAVGDTSPDSWGRRLMQRAERRAAERGERRVRTLGEADFLLGVSDESRLGALRFRPSGIHEFQAPVPRGVPPLIELGRLLASTDRIVRDEASDEDLSRLLAPGSSLGGARPKASVRDAEGRLAIAKFPKEDDEYSLETWEAIAFRLATMAGIETPVHELVTVAGRAVLLSRRFDRREGARVPFVSAMTLLGALDGEPGSYPDIVDALAEHGGRPRQDAHALYRRVVFNVLVSNVDDHLRNHGFLHEAGRGWHLSPAYDLNPVPEDLKARVLATNIDDVDGSCSIALVREVAPLFDLDAAAANGILREVADATRRWREVASAFGERPATIARMASAFEHDELDAALAPA